MKKRYAIIFMMLMLLSLIPANAFADETYDQVRYLIETHYVDEVSDEILSKPSIEEMVYALHDPYSAYIDPESFRGFLSSLDGRYVGIGVIISKTGDYVEVAGIFPGGPADKAGMLVGDLIVMVNGKSMKGLSVNEVSGAIKGEEGTPVVVTVKRDSQFKEIKMLRAAIIVPSVEYRMIGPNLGYIKLYSFDSTSPEEMDQALDILTANGMETLVLDLRDNPGGLLDAVTKMSGNFIPKGPVVHVIQRGDNEIVLRSFRSPRGIPLVVLVNQGTASASEILSGAIQDTNTGYILGTNTYGKGCVQTIFTLRNGGGLKLTTAKYLTSGGQDINQVGITPDIMESDETKQLALAIKTLQEEQETYDVQISIGSDVVFANNNFNEVSVAPYQYNGKVIVPLRSFAEYFGTSVVWTDGKARIIGLKENIIIDVKNSRYIIDGKAVETEVVIKNGSIMVPARLLGETFGYQVEWRKNLNEVTFSKVSQ